MSRGKPPSGTDLNDHFLSRWSRRKHAATKGPLPEVEQPDPLEATAPAVPAVQDENPAPAPLPPVESLTPESDFTPFMRPEVDELLKRRALRTLFQDPRFNVMDGLDVYIADFSQPDPLPEGWLEKLNQVARLGDYRPPEEAAEKPAESAPEAGSEGASEAASGPSADPEPMPSEVSPPDTPATESGSPEVPES